VFSFSQSIAGTAAAAAEAAATNKRPTSKAGKVYRISAWYIRSMAWATMDKIVSLCKRRGFLFQGSELYGGLQGTWDYGPMGVELKNSVKRAWWRANVYERDDMEGLDAAILMNRLVLKYSGHEA